MPCPSAADPVGRRAHDDVLQVLQAGVRAPMEGLRSDDDGMVAAKRALQVNKNEAEGVASRVYFGY